MLCCTLFGVSDRVSFVEIVAEEYTWLSNQFFKFSHDGIRCNVMSFDAYVRFSDGLIFHQVL